MDLPRTRTYAENIIKYSKVEPHYNKINADFKLIVLVYFMEHSHLDCDIVHSDRIIDFFGEKY
jgi:hypothetical protein